MSRITDIGLLWEDLPPIKGQRNRDRGPMPEVPETGWRPPQEFPNLTGAKVIGLDTETKDPELTTSGPGWARGVGHIIGASLSVEDGSSWYFPMRHESCPEWNLDPDQVLNYLRYTLGGTQPKVGANLIYDIGWLRQENVHVGGRLYDIQFAEALLNSEAPDVTLEGLALQYLGQGKVTSELYEWLSRWCGGPATERQRANLYLSPPQLAGPYAESDASLPIAILGRQWPRMQERGVLDLFDLECRLIPLLVLMRFRGAPVNVSKAEKLYEELGKDLKTIETQLTNIAGQAVNPNARESQAAAFKKLGIPIPSRIDKKTGEERITFSAPVLETIDHPIASTILEYRRIEKVKNTFVKGYIIDKNVNGRLHCSFHPLKGEKGGARSGRFSSSDPNLQNIPVRTEIGRRVRLLFEVLIGRWRKFDHSQIEYRMLAHHAVGPGAEEVRETYRNDPTTDYHVLTGGLVTRMTSLELPRRNVKNINFGLIYGMAEPKLASDLGLKLQEGKELFKTYHAAAPFIKETMQEAAREVHTNGFITTILGRRSDFNRWGKKGYDEERRALSYDAASRLWGIYNIERAMTHKALNRRLQGGAADVMKKGMVDAYEAGLFADDACGIPCLTVHDELDFEDQGDLDNPAWKELAHIMETCLPQLSVPLKMDSGYGPSWGEIE